MRRSLEVLALLQDGEPHAGGDLAAHLGVSRAAVWNHVRRLREAGIEVSAGPGRGYRLDAPYEPLDAERIGERLRRAGAREIGPVEVAGVVDSTNQCLLERLARGSVHGQVLLAEYQSAGRGRRGERWIAPPGSGLCLSMGWRFDSPPATFSALSLVVGLGIARTLRDAGAKAVRLKWPNDIVHGADKLGGILIEMRSEAGGPCETVIGIGLNVRLSRLARTLIDQPSGDIESATGARVSRNELAASLLAALEQDLVVFAQHGFDPFRDAWPAYDALAGRMARVVLPDRSVAGTARGVDAHGALLLEHNGVVEAFMAGHVQRM